MNPLIYLLNLLLDIANFALLVWIILSWLISFRVVNPHQPLVYQLNNALNRLFEPVCRKLRPYMPDLGNIDITPIAIWIILKVAQYSLHYYFY